jgi:hypothetical protein
MKLRRYDSFINESENCNWGNISIEVDGYILHDDDIYEFFSKLYKDISDLEKSEMCITDVTENDHAHIRSFLKVPKSYSQFKVSFYISEKNVSIDFRNRFYQYYYCKFILDPEVLKDIDSKVYNRIGFKLIKSSPSKYSDTLFGGSRDGYVLDFYFSKDKKDNI